MAPRSRESGRIHGHFRGISHDSEWGLNAQGRRRTTCRDGKSERADGEINRAVSQCVTADVRRQCANARDNGNRANRHGNADAKRRNDDIRFGVISVLERVIPLIKHLHDGAADTDRQNRGDSEPSQFHLTAV